MYFAIIDSYVATFDICVFYFCLDPCDECVSNSTCEPQSDGNVNCVCPTGYNGTNCNNYIGVCIPNPCMNNGNCQDIPVSFKCLCPLPLSGRLCEVDTINDCDPNPCMNGGSCKDLIDRYICQCALGYAGRDCNFKGFHLCMHLHVVTCVCCIVGKFGRGQFCCIW